MTSPDVHTLTGAYALDALEQFERHHFQEHLARCPDCEREVAELRATGAKLGLAVATRPPESLRHKVLAAVAATRQDPPATRVTGASATSSARARRRDRLIAAVAAVAAAAAVVFGVVAVRTGHERDVTEAQLAQLQDRYAAVAQLAAEPDARGSSGAGVAGGTAFVLASHRLNRAMLMVSELPAAPPGHIYQAWLIGHGHPRSVGLVGPTAPAQAAPLQFGDLAGAAKVGLTIEPAGGSPQPTTTPVVLVDLPS